MAGIGIRLQSLATQGSILGATTAYLAATIITAGPWLSGVAALFILRVTTSSYLSGADHALLLATIVTAFAASLIVAAGPRMLVTRYVADCLYLHDLASIASTSTGVLFLLIPFILVSAPFWGFAHFSLQYRLIVTTLFLALSMIWIMVTFISAIYQYVYIVVTFLLCYAFGILRPLCLHHDMGCWVVWEGLRQDNSCVSLAYLYSSIWNLLQAME